MHRARYLVLHTIHASLIRYVIPLPMYRAQYTSLHHAPCTIHVTTPCTVHNTRHYTMNRAQHTSLHHAPCTIHVTTPCTVHNTRHYTMHSVLRTSDPSPSHTLSYLPPTLFLISLPHSFLSPSHTLSYLPPTLSLISLSHSPRSYLPLTLSSLLSPSHTGMGIHSNRRPTYRRCARWVY
jgi:hypothetical protein